MRLVAVLAMAGSLVLVACSAAGTATPAPSSDAAPATTEVATLLAGMRLDLQGDCAPLRSDLPATAIGAIECRPTSDVADRAAVYLFDTEADLMAVYLDRVQALGISLRSGGGRCLPGVPSEGAYTPGDSGPDLLAVRGACWVDEAGKAHYLATQPPFVLIEVDGAVGDPEAVERFAWLGNQDTPGEPTLWRSDGPASPEK